VRRPTGLSLEEAFAWYPRLYRDDGCHQWISALSEGYGQFRYGRVKYYAHRVAYELAHGLIPAGMDIDHRCRNRACVNPDHLRLATRKQNLENKAGPGLGSKTGIRGVSWSRVANAWTARVTHNGRTHCAYFKEIDEAAEWVLAKRLELFTHNEADRLANAV
jgi:hypothetical protein